MQSCSLLTRELSRSSAIGDMQRASQLSAQAQQRSMLDLRPVAAELQAILRGHPGGCDYSGRTVFGTSPPPRDCHNALVRDVGFTSMREGRSVTYPIDPSCATVWHYANARGSSCDKYRNPASSSSPYFGSPVSVLSPAAAA